MLTNSLIPLQASLDASPLQIVWFLLIAVLWIGFFFLEGFDFGVSMLYPILGKDPKERRVMINTIGPTWDGNEVWLITAGGATFAAFPGWYATLFSGLYLPLFLVLVLSWLEHWLDEHLPDIIKALAVPFICTIVMVPLTILVIGPVSNVLANAIAAGYNFLANNVPALAAILVGGISF